MSSEIPRDAAGLLLRMGRRLGPDLRDDGSEYDAVRLGGRTYQLTDDEAHAWHAAADPRIRFGGTAELIRECTDLGLADPERLVAGLVQRGLVLDVAAAPVAWRELANRVRMMPALPYLPAREGYENVLIAADEGRMTMLPEFLHDLYSRCAAEPSLATAIDHSAERAAKNDVQPPRLADTGALLEIIIEELTWMIGAGVVYLDWVDGQEVRGD